jgi:hypothetical protein
VTGDHVQDLRRAVPALRRAVVTRAHDLLRVLARPGLRMRGRRVRGSFASFPDTVRCKSRDSVGAEGLMSHHRP